jgi:hypothetical protein
MSMILCGGLVMYGWWAQSLSMVTLIAGGRPMVSAKAATAAGFDRYMTKPIDTRTFSVDIAAFIAAIKRKSELSYK